MKGGKDKILNHTAWTPMVTTSLINTIMVEYIDPTAGPDVFRTQKGSIHSRNLAQEPPLLSRFKPFHM